MTIQPQLPNILRDVLLRAASAPSSQLARMAHSPIVRGTVTHEVERMMMTWLKESRSDPSKLPGVEDDRAAMGLAIVNSVDRALEGNHLSDAYIRSVLQILVKDLFIEQGDQSAAQRFQTQYGLLLSFR